MRSGAGWDARGLITMMCGRFSLAVPPEVVKEVFGVSELPSLPRRYNVAPTQDVLVVRREPASGVRVAELARFGLVPPGSRDVKGSAKLINARQETAFDRAPFSRAARRHRVLIPADGFYEWKKTEHGKDPQWIRLASGRPFGLGGLFSRAQLPDGAEVASCCVLTTRPNALVASIHDRMPVIIPESAFDLWLDPSVVDRASLEHLLSPFPAEELAVIPVSRRVNDVANDDEACVAPPEESAPKRRPQLGFDFDDR